MALLSMALPVLKYICCYEVNTSKSDVANVNLVKVCMLPHDVGSRWLLVGERLGSAQTCLVAVKQVPNCRA